MVDSLNFVTIGELIKQKREEKGLSLSEVSRITGISKGVISKIESGETKRPELRTLKPMADVLNIPYEQIIELYIEVEHRFGILHEFLMEVAEISKPDLMEKVSIKFLENAKKDSVELLEDLFEIAGTFEKEDIRLTLYGIVIKYARSHGESRYIAKGLYQKYLIEREDLKHLEDSFKIGEEALHYVDFLSPEEKITLYYRMSLHAHNIRKYKKCVDLGEKGHAEDRTINELGERVALAILNSNSRMGKYSELDKLLEKYVALGYSLIIEKIKYFRAIILSKTGHRDEAIPLLRACVEEASKEDRLHRINDLVEVLLEIDDVNSLKSIFEQEKQNTLVQVYTPYKYLELGKYFKNKGTFLIKGGLFTEGMEAYIQGMDFYSNINDLSGIMECSEKIYSYHCEHGKELELGLLKKMKKVYSIVNNGDERGGKNEKTFNFIDDCFTGVM
ncbi:helix-turn-helix domain-containing protein (plasmid) [Brevibacillus halotolerans]|nr:helix-turn-helix domain-containing protein [Brevibacillus halotolerans]